MWVRRSKAPASSSRAKTTPATGVLKAAETPAAPPATIIARRPGPPRRPRVRERTMPASTCTVGPSRPIEAPHASRAADRTTLTAAVRRVTRCPPQRPRHRCSAAAITWGMPLPAASGANRWVSQAASVSPTGSRSRVAHGAAASQRACTAIAASHRRANIAAARPPRMATATTTPVRHRTRRRKRMRRRSRRLAEGWEESGRGRRTRLVCRRAATAGNRNRNGPALDPNRELTVD